MKDVISKINEEKDRLEKQNKKLAKSPLTKSNQLSKSSDILVSKETQTCQLDADLVLTTNTMTFPNKTTFTNNNLSPVLPKLRRSSSPCTPTRASTPPRRSPSPRTQPRRSSSPVPLTANSDSLINHDTTNKIEDKSELEDKSEIKYNCGQTSSDKEIKIREKVRISIKKKVDAKFADNLLTKEEADLLEAVLVDDMERTISEEIKLFRMNLEFGARRQ